MINHAIRRFFLLGLLLLAVGPPAAAAEVRRPDSRACAVSPECCLWASAYSSPSPIVLADSWSLGKFVTGGGRARIVQICVVVMCLALFIMMRKLN